MMLVTKARTFGRMLGRTGRQMQRLRAMFAERGKHMAQRGIQMTRPTPPNYLRLGVESRLEGFEKVDQHIAHLLKGGDVNVNIPGASTHLKPTSARRASQDWQYGVEAMTMNPRGRRSRLAKNLRQERKDSGPKTVRKRLQLIGLEFRKRRTVPSSDLKRISA